MKDDQIKQFLEGIFKLMPNYKQRILTPPLYQGKKLSFLQHTSIMILHDKSPLTLNQLSELNNIAKQQMSKIVESLIELDLVNRVIDPNNHRQVLLSLSENGQNFIHELQNERYNFLKRILSKYTEEELISLNEHVKAITEILGSK